MIEASTLIIRPTCAFPSDFQRTLFEVLQQRQGYVYVEPKFLISNFNLQVEDNVNSDWCEEDYQIAYRYAKLMEAGVVFPPLIATSRKYGRILDGNHRLIALMMVGIHEHSFIFIDEQGRKDDVETINNDGEHHPGRS